MMLTPNQVSINYFMNQLNIQFKVCIKCNLSLSVDKFDNRARSKDGLQSKCKNCRAGYYQLNKDKFYQYDKDKSAKYYQKNKKTILEKKTIRDKNNYDNDPKFRASVNLRKATRRLFKGVDKSKKTLKILGVSSFEDALNRLLKTMPEGYTLQDFLDGKLVIDHKIPLSWFNLTIESELMEAGNINNLQLLTAQDNLTKSAKYGHMPDGSIILYEDWVMTRGIKING